MSIFKIHREGWDDLVGPYARVVAVHIRDPDDRGRRLRESARCAAANACCGEATAEESPLGTAVAGRLQRLIHERQAQWRAWSDHPRYSETVERAVAANAWSYVPGWGGYWTLLVLGSLVGKVRRALGRSPEQVCTSRLLLGQCVACEHPLITPPYAGRIKGAVASCAGCGLAWPMLPPEVPG